LNDISHSILSKEVNLDKLGQGIRIRSPRTAHFGLHAVACSKNSFLGDEQREVVATSDIFDPETSLKEEGDKVDLLDPISDGFRAASINDR
jgi:hypothetical protein